MAQCALKAQSALKAQCALQAQYALQVQCALHVPLAQVLLVELPGLHVQVVKMAQFAVYLLDARDAVMSKQMCAMVGQLVLSRQACVEHNLH